MYRHSLRIAVFTHNPLLETEIRAIEPLERFNHEILIHKEFIPSVMANSDIVIMDVPTSLTFRQIRMRAKSNTKLVACLPPGVEAEMSMEDVESLDDIWLTPLHAPRIRLRMNHILYGIKRDDDAKQHMIWLDTLIDSMPDLVWFKDLDGIHHKVNSKFCQFVKKSRTTVEGSTHAAIWDVPEEKIDQEEYACMASENAAIASGKTFLTDEIVKSGDEKHLLKTYKTPLKGLSGEILGTVGFAHDLTNLLNLDMELNFFIESMPFPLILCNVDNTIKQVNSNFAKFFEVDKEKIIGQSFDEWQNSTFHKERSPVTGQDFLCFPRREKMLCVSLTNKEILDIFDKPVGRILIFRDITAEKELEIRIWNDANTDALTGLANRHAFGNFIKKLPEEAFIHLLYIDLDEFKAVNDQWGHKVGDEAIRSVADAIREVFTEDFPVRLGGDEFLICIQRAATMQDLETLAGRLLSLIQKKFSESRFLSKMSASIGIRGCGSVGDSIEKLIKQADRAMYRAKSLGKSRYVIWDESIDSVA